jgi:uncharacterized repeat protein (TIGR01451 family)
MEGLEQLEQRSLMAADLVVTLNDNTAASVDRTFYSPGSQVVYTLTVENKGDATATDALIKTSLASAITGATWSTQKLRAHPTAKPSARRSRFPRVPQLRSRSSARFLGMPRGS